jgi:hypothetical protein
MRAAGGVCEIESRAGRALELKRRVELYRTAVDQKRAHEQWASGVSCLMLGDDRMDSGFTGWGFHCVTGVIAEQNQNNGG